jgi:lipoate-protein ligase B
VTYHGPGQLVVYPILDLSRHKKDLHWYVRTVEETVIETLRSFGVRGERSSVNSGVWVGNDKICAVGISASRWLTMHGGSLNISCDLKMFEQIVPCGITEQNRGVTSVLALRQAGVAAPKVEEVGLAFLIAFRRIFGFETIDYRAEDELAAILLKYPDIVTAAPNLL